MKELAELKALLKEKGIEHYSVSIDEDTFWGTTIHVHIYDDHSKSRKTLFSEDNSIDLKEALEKYFIENQTLTPQF
jgi:L-rhamnose mutarotase